jgi:uncharacterized repeat protein (TIGR02543 family)
MITTKNIREAHPITDLTAPFTLNGYGFRIKVTKKAADKADTLSVTGKLLGVDTSSTTLIKSEQWSDEIYKEISAAIFTHHNLEWGVEFATNYSVTYNLDGGLFIDENGNRVATQDSHVTWGGKATEPTVGPTLLDHTFKGWQLDEVDFDFDDVITDDITLVATWLENFTVTFDSDGGSAVTAQEIADGATATEPSDPSKAGYAFVKWNLDGATYNFATAVTEDIELTAVWVEVFAVTFDSQGGSAVATQQVPDGEAATEPTDPTKAEFVFDRWSIAVDGAAYNFATAVTAPLTLYAIWTS